MTNQQILKQEFLLEAEKKEHEIEKMKFCIISCYKSQMSRNRLLMFALDVK